MNDLFNYPLIQFLNSSKDGYVDRTIKNASADATIAVASNFDTAGERLTKKSVLNQSKVYIPINIKESLRIINPSLINILVDALNKENVKNLNIAGNGLYALKANILKKI